MTRSDLSRWTVFVFAIDALFASRARAQDLIISSLAIPMYAESTAPGPYFPGPNAPRFPVFEMMPIPPAPVPFMGDLTMNNATGVIYHTNGTLITSTNHPAYPPLAPVVPPFATPAGMGPLTGIAIDGATGILWCTDGVVGMGVLPIPGTPPIGPPFPILGPIPIVALPLTGLDWDPLTASLWAVDIMGNVYNFLPGPVAIPIGPQPVIPFLPILAPPAVDLVLHRHPRILPGIHVQGVGVSVNFLTGIVSPTPPFIPPGTEDGIAFHNYPNVLPVPTCMFCPGVGPVTTGTAGPMSLGNAGFALTLSGGPPFTPCFFAADTIAVLPPLAGPSGCALYLSPVSPSLLVIPLGTGAGGGAILPVPLVGLPPAALGLTVFIQWAFPCPIIPGSLLLSESQQFILEAP